MFLSTLVAFASLGREGTGLFEKHILRPPARSENACWRRLAMQVQNIAELQINAYYTSMYCIYVYM